MRHSTNQRLCKGGKSRGSRGPKLPSLPASGHRGRDDGAAGLWQPPVHGKMTYIMPLSQTEHQGEISPSNKFSLIVSIEHIYAYIRSIERPHWQAHP